MTFFLDELSDGVKSLLPHGVVFSCGKFDSSTKESFEEEIVHLKNEPVERVKEFISGRNQARLALAKLGCSPISISADLNGCPLWPPGFIGSITHKENLALAVVARTTDILGIGLDLEVLHMNDDSLWSRISSETERTALEKTSSLGKTHLSTLLFSAKEAAFKCIYPFVRTREIDFQDLRLTFGDQLEFQIDAPKFKDSLPNGVILKGRATKLDNFILNIVYIKSMKSNS